MPPKAGWVAAVLLAGLALASPASAQSGGLVVHGRVVEVGTGQPIGGAAVQVGASSAISGRDGRWQATLAAGSYALRVQRAGYAARTLTLTVPADEELRLELAPQALALDAFVVTASRRMQRLAEAPITTELIGKEELRRSGASDLSTALGEQTGIQLSGGRPYGEGVMLQGFSTERVLVLLDGQPLGGRIAGTQDVSRIPISIVERVEVVKGSQSALYGSEAMGGVINIVTRRPSERWTGGGDLTLGTQNRLDTSLSASGKLGGAALLVQGGRRAADAAPGRVDQGGAFSERWDGLAKAVFSPTERTTLELGSFLVDESQRWNSGQLYYFVDNQQHTARASASWAGERDHLSGTLYFSDFEHLFRRAAQTTPAGPEGDHETQRLWKAEALYNLALGRHALDLGVEAAREERTSDRALHVPPLHSAEPFAQATFSRGNLSVVPGGRLSWSEQWGSAFTPRLALLYRPTSPLALRASVGRGYRAPNFEELYLEFLNVGPGFGYVVRGNPELRPETATNLSAGAEWAQGRFYLRAQTFHNRFDDFIENILVADSSGLDIYSYGNVARGITQGVELEGGLTWRQGRIEGGFSTTHTRDLGSDRPLLGHPGRTARLSLQHDLPLGVRGQISGTYTGTTPLQQTEARIISRDPFLRFDARLSRTLPRGLEASLGARNLFDAHPAEWPGFIQRQVYLGVGWNR